MSDMERLYAQRGEIIERQVQELKTMREALEAEALRLDDTDFNNEETWDGLGGLDIRESVARTLREIAKVSQ